MGDRSYPRWLVYVTLIDGGGEDGGSDTFAATVESAPNRREAIRQATSVLPGDDGDPLLLRMLAWSQEAPSGLHLPSVRLVVTTRNLEEVTEADDE